jgi:hypothetical protein
MSHSDLPISSSNSDASNATRDRWEVRFSLALTIFAAVLAVNELGASKYGDDEIQFGNEKTKAYMWFQSKSIKESVVKGQADILDTLVESGTLATDKVAAVQSLRKKLHTDIARYKREKDEILRGSKAVGEANWAQEVDGKLGQVVGAKDFEDQQARLSRAGDRFDLATLFLQVCIVFGAVGLIVKRDELRMKFFVAMISLGVLGASCCALGYRIAFG